MSKKDGFDGIEIWVLACDDAIIRLREKRREREEKGEKGREREKKRSERERERGRKREEIGDVITATLANSVLTRSTYR